MAQCRSALEESGVGCVMMGGMRLMPQWSVSSWDFSQKVCDTQTVGANSQSELMHL